MPEGPPVEPTTVGPFTVGATTVGTTPVTGLGVVATKLPGCGKGGVMIGSSGRAPVAGAFVVGAFNVGNFVVTTTACLLAAFSKCVSRCFHKGLARCFLVLGKCDDFDRLF